MTKNGIITKGIGGFYYVTTKTGKYECKARGIFRKENIMPLVGDTVQIEETPNQNYKGTIIKINPRKSELVRPKVANVTQVLIVFAWANPTINLVLLDKFILQAEKQSIKIIICLNKSDLIKEKTNIENIYTRLGYDVINTSIINKTGISEITKHLKGEITVLAGTSGVGKSTLINALIPGSTLKTGELSKKISRGKHTTRHSELIEVDSDTFLLDTPGFASFDINAIVDKDELEKYYKEIYKYAKDCKFIGCNHQTEPKCAVIAQIGKEISIERYNNFIALSKEISQQRKINNE